MTSPPNGGGPPGGSVPPGGRLQTAAVVAASN